MVPRCTIWNERWLLDPQINCLSAMERRPRELPYMRATRRTSPSVRRTSLVGHLLMSITLSCAAPTWISPFLHQALCSTVKPSPTPVVSVCGGHFWKPFPSFLRRVVDSLWHMLSRWFSPAPRVRVCEIQYNVRRNQGLLLETSSDPPGTWQEGPKEKRQPRTSIQNVCHAINMYIKYYISGGTVV